MFLSIFSHYLPASKRILLYNIVSDLKLFKIKFIRKDSAYSPAPGAKCVIDK